MAIERICDAPGCSNQYYSKGYCRLHYQRWKAHGHIEPTRGRSGEALAFLHALVDAEAVEDCVQWPFGRTPNGYGRILIQGQKRVASRVVCEVAHGAPPTPDHQAAHSCGKGHEGCVNPLHLRWATPEENRADMIAHGTAHGMEFRKNNIVKPYSRSKRRAPIGKSITEDDVREIRRLHASGLGARTIGKMYGKGPSTVARIFRRETWKHVA